MAPALTASPGHTRRISGIGSGPLNGAAVGFGPRDEEDAVLVPESNVVDLVLEFRWELAEGENLLLRQRLGRDGFVIGGFEFLE